MKNFTEYLKEGLEEWDWEEDETENKLTYYVKVSIPVKDVDDDYVKASIKRGIYMGLDIKRIAKPSDVDIKIK